MRIICHHRNQRLEVESVWRCGYLQSIESSRDVESSGYWGEKWLTCRRAEVKVHEHDVNLILGIVALFEVLQRLVRTAIATGSRAQAAQRYSVLTA